MFLAVDIGNTCITLAVYEKNDFTEVFNLASDLSKNVTYYENEIKNVLAKYEITECAIVSVVDELNTIIKNAVDNVYNINSVLITHKSNLGIKIDTENPDTMGIDRIANALYAVNNCRLPAIIVDIGSAITIDIVDKYGIFKGGIIMPGIRLQLLSLFQNTSKLPIIEIQDIHSIIGKNTKDCILSGVINGTAFAIDGHIKQFKIELNQNCTTVGTGGTAEFISKHMKSKFDTLNRFVTLHGIKILYDLNK